MDESAHRRKPALLHCKHYLSENSLLQLTSGDCYLPCEAWLRPIVNSSLNLRSPLPLSTVVSRILRLKHHMSYSSYLPLRILTLSVNKWMHLYSFYKPSFVGLVFHLCAFVIQAALYLLSCYRCNC